MKLSLILKGYSKNYILFESMMRNSKRKEMVMNFMEFLWKDSDGF